MKLISLSKGFNAIVDDEYFEIFSNYKWHVNARARTQYAMRVSRKGERPRKTKLYMHRLIMNPPEGYVCDHINGNGLDNRKENLRIATKKENQGNRRKLKIGESIYKGVRKTKYGRFRAYVRRGKRQIGLGSFSNEIEAAKAYDKFSEGYFGEFANKNIKEIATI